MHVEILCRLAELVNPFDGLRQHMIDPHADLAGTEYERQTVIALSDLMCHLPFTDAVEGVVYEEY